MFIKATSGYTASGEQRASGLFLIVVSPKREIGQPHTSEIRAIVRHVRMHQFGHFMMGAARVGPHRIPLSGTYGADGLTRDVPADVWEYAVPIPADLIEAFWSGGGHNSAGAEGPDMRAWALANLRALRRPWKAKP